MPLLTLHGSSVFNTGWHKFLQVVYIVAVLVWISTQGESLPRDLFLSYFRLAPWHIFAGLAAALALVIWQVLILRPLSNRLLSGAYDDEVRAIRIDRAQIPLALQITENTCVGFLEELIYRAMMIPMCGVLFAVLLFVIPHLARSPRGQVVVYANAFVCGVALSLLFLWTGSLWAAVVAHALHNITIEILVKKRMLSF